MEKNYLLQGFHRGNAALQAKIKKMSLRSVRAAFRAMRKAEHHQHRTEYFHPTLGCTLGEFSVLQLIKPY